MELKQVSIPAHKLYQNYQNQNENRTTKELNLKIDQLKIDVIDFPVIDVEYLADQFQIYLVEKNLINF